MFVEDSTGRSVLRGQLRVFTFLYDHEEQPFGPHLHTFTLVYVLQMD
jgi:hypothetical protein